MAAKDTYTVSNEKASQSSRTANGDTDSVRPRHHRLHDPSVSFEEYLHYAKLTRAEEDEAARRDGQTGRARTITEMLLSRKADDAVPMGAAVEEKTVTATAITNGQLEISSEEWMYASRALRTATWGACFYLITTDILGPWGLPFAFGTTGWGPGTVLYTVFGALAYYSGWLLWKMFLGLDSYQYPLRSYSDLAFRIYGTWARHCCNFLQALQLLCSIGLIIIGNGQGLSQVAKFRLCFAVCCLVWAIAGILVGQVRTLKRYGIFASAAIWINIFVAFMTMAVAATSAPNYSGAQQASAGSALSGPGGSLVAQLQDGTYPQIQHSTGLPDSGSFIGSVNGFMQAVYAYGGAMIFCELMAEMRRPRDFLKALTLASGFIWFFYMFFGLFMYGYQGQYVIQPAMQGLSPYGWQTAGNILSMISSLICAGLYGNIGIKVLYNNLLIEWLKFPALTSKSGKLIWIALVPVYWSIAYVLAAAIPNYFGLTSLVAALCIMQFTYVFPPLLYVGYMIKKNARQEGECFDVTTRHDTGLSCWIRGFLAERWYLNVWNLIYGLGAAATAGLGAYSAIMALIATFQQPTANAFTCHSPLDG
ncbi:N amino acid transport system protein [Pseudocercospora fuligena]|uniref:N amino acid transport system protein n=1 Tax=Pseudocercospora fuligena TaxID=685502 RepID=A0A8H6R8L6_9PEZI|nr:N amino acid transport system protein [Pseudocercospora fuligena]